MPRISTIALAAAILVSAVPAHADRPLDELARQVERAEGLRAAKELQRNYAQYAQAGLWDEIGALFAADGKFIFEAPNGPVEAAQRSGGDRPVPARPLWRRARTGLPHATCRPC